MARHLTFLFRSAFFPLILVGSLVAAEPANNGEAKLRDALRESMLQLRSAQGELATVQSAQAALVDEKTAISAKYEALQKQIAAEHASTDKTLSTMTTQVADQKSQIAKLAEELKNSRSENEKTAQALKVVEAERAKLTIENSALERKVADREAKNIALFTLGNQILRKYEDFSLGKALSAKEPFVGTTRVRLENLMQDYEDMLLDQKISH